jgi:hypothetical protein
MGNCCGSPQEQGEIGFKTSNKRKGDASGNTMDEGMILQEPEQTRTSESVDKQLTDWINHESPLTDDTKRMLQQLGGIFVYG